MASLWKTANPPQQMMLKMVAGAVLNVYDHHNQPRDKRFARSVAKRAVGTLTAGWPDVLAARTLRRQASLRENSKSRNLRSSDLREGHLKGDRLNVTRRSPVQQAWRKIREKMWYIKQHGTPEELQVHIKVLQLLDQAQKLLESLEK